jgi:hypothetical protein
MNAKAGRRVAVDIMSQIDRREITNLCDRGDEATASTGNDRRLFHYARGLRTVVSLASKSLIGASAQHNHCLEEKGPASTPAAPLMHHGRA